ncbi:MAG: topoisomerase C-terminal repeat-containing protein, partial [Patescibacteria group bacterium]
KPEEAIGNDPATGGPIFVKTGRFGPYVELVLPMKEVVAVPETPLLTKSGKPSKRKPKKVAGPKPELRRASIPAGVPLDTVDLKLALHYLSLPRELGSHPTSGKPIIANIGRFGPYVGHDGEFRSLKKLDDPYTITLERAIAVLAEPKLPPKGVTIIRELGKHPKTGKTLTLYKSKSGYFLKKGLRRISLPESMNPDTLSAEEAASYLT